MAISVPRPRILLVILLALVAALALFHPASPTHHSALSGSSSSSSSKYQKYPPALPHREGGGFFANGTSMSGAGRRQANATFVILARNGDLWDVISAMQNMEDRFNWWAKYPYVFLNDEPFDANFIKYTQEIASSTCEYGLIPKEEWNQPDWIDEEKATAAREQMVKDNVIYGGSVPYRNMCRFNSGFFYRQPLMMKYRYYWRIEPSVKFFCDIRYDPFLVMMDEKKVYGFTLSLFEFTETIVTLWDATKEFMTAHPEHLAAGNSMDFLSDDGGKEYNHCHFWSNFEIGDLDFWRGKAYSDYFDFLEKKGGFYYERWGDAPVHSIGAGLFASKDQIKFFSDIGYFHGPYTHCPQGDAHAVGRCSCKEEDNFDDHWFSCTKKWKAIHPGGQWYGSP